MTLSLFPNVSSKKEDDLHELFFFGAIE